MTLESATKARAPLHPMKRWAGRRRTSPTAKLQTVAVNGGDST